MTDLVLVERDDGSDGAVLTMTLNRPERLNAVTEGLMDAFDDALRDAEADDTVRVVRLRGGGPGVLRWLRPGLGCRDDARHRRGGSLGSDGRLQPAEPVRA